MRRRGRSTPTAAVLASVLVGVLAAMAPASADRPAAHRPRGAFAVVQYAATGRAPLPWNAHLVSGANPALTTTGGPRAAADAVGGVQIVYRNPSGDVIWMDGTGRGSYSPSDLTTLGHLGPLASQPVATVGPTGLDEVFCVTKSGHLVELTLESPPWVALHTKWYPAPPTWGATDLTRLGGPAVWTTPSVLVNGTTTWVFTRTRSGDVVEYVSDGLGGRAWSGYDLSVMSGGPKAASDPAALFDPTTGEVRVATTEQSPNHGDVVVFSPDDVGGRVWSFQDVSAATRTAPASGGVAAVVLQGAPTLFAPGPTGDLTEYEGTDATNATTWKSVDLTSSVPGAPQVSGTPSAATLGTEFAVSAVAAAWGNLFVWTNTGPAGSVVATDVSIGGAGPSRTVAGTPATLFEHGVLSLFGAGVAVPAPEGTGVYAVPWTKWSQALKDGWPILGVTGGLGSQCAPWTSYTGVPTSTPPDEYVGQAIQSSHERATWLSFWTVSGPRTPHGTACSAEKGPVTAHTYFAHGFAAGAWVAAQIDAYRGSGLALKPDWVIFDPEGYPDNHSGLWGPTSPPSRLSASVANWFAMLAGWHAGIASVDPALKAAVYANPYEYMTYHLFAQPLPSFIAGAFSEQPVRGVQTLVAPTRTAFGPNIRGFVMFNTFTPTCTQVNNERQLLTRAPWDGSYNTVQTPPGTYCPPGPPAPG